MLALFILAAASAAADMYSCTPPNGKPILRDRPIEECANVTQILRRADGVTVRIPSPDEKASAVAAAEKAEEERKKQLRLDMANHLLVTRFPNEAAHAKRRAEELAPLRAAIRNSEARTEALEAEHRRLMNEREFYPPPMAVPEKLKRDIGANEATLAAQRDIHQGQRAEYERISATMDVELAKLRRLWSKGAPEGGGPRASASAIDRKQ